MKLTEITISEAQKALREKKISAVELTEEALSQAEKTESKINSFVTLTPEVAREQAKAADARLAKGEQAPLLGIPLAVKDCFCTKGTRSTNSSHMLENFIPPYDATSYARVKAQGSVMIGKTNTDEFTMGSSTETSYFGTTANPWDTERVAGGSSGGSAASISTGTSLGALGTDTGGSIRQPAAFCGCSGIKPTYGLIPRTGVMSMASSLDTIGCFAKTCEDLAIILKEMAGPDKKDVTASSQEIPDYLAHLDGNIAGMRIGIPKEFFVEGLDSEVEKRTQEAIDQFKKMGAEVVEVSLPHTKYAIATYYIIAPAEISSNMARYDGIRYGHRTENNPENLIDFYEKTRSEGFGAEVKRRIMIGTYVLSAGYYDAYYKKAQKVRTLIRKDYDEAFQKVDALVTPTTPTPSFKIGENVSNPLKMYLNDILTVSANMAGVVGMSIPCGFAEGLPVGLQILTPQFAETTALKIGDAYQKVTDFHKKYPQL